MLLLGVYRFDIYDCLWVRWRSEVTWCLDAGVGRWGLLPHSGLLHVRAVRREGLEENLGRDDPHLLNRVEAARLALAGIAFLNRVEAGG